MYCLHLDRVERALLLQHRQGGDSSGGSMLTWFIFLQRQALTHIHISKILYPFETHCLLTLDRYLFAIFRAFQPTVHTILDNDLHRMWLLDSLQATREEILLRASNLYE